mmetsp:Transcript_102294/g.218962  ORF Transcript_102294/g.218962 Transcript_102294/m.218962 type:complete len:433 (-) Transcript_102294:116-1414(-)
MAFSGKFGSRAKAAPASPPPADEGGDSGDEVESVDEEEQAHNDAKQRREEEEARAKAMADAKAKAQAAEREAARKATQQEELARKRKAQEEAREKAAEEERRRKEYEAEKARQATIARSKAETAKRFGGPGASFGSGAPKSGGGFGGGGGGAFAWKKSGASAAGGGKAGPGSSDPRHQDLPSHDDCEMAISAMISRSFAGMKDGLTALGLSVFKLKFTPGQELELCGHNVREEINEMIHAWMTDEKDEFYNCLLQVKERTAKPLITEEEMAMMEDPEEWVKIAGPGGKSFYTKREAGAASGDRPAKAKPAIKAAPVEEVEDIDDDDDEVIDVGPSPGGPTAAPKGAARPAAQAARAVPGEEDYYTLLGVASGATLHEIRTKFRTLVITEHPEKGGDPKKFAKLNKAYSILSDQKKRAEYDQSLQGGGRTFAD